MNVQNARRLDFEARILSQKLPQFQLYRLDYGPVFTGYQRVVSAPGFLFQLALCIPEWYPDEMPSLYVVSPRILTTYDGISINSLGASHAFHTCSNGPGGVIQICHFNTQTWDASKTCVGVFFKGILWLEAYGVHLATGMRIADILDQWKERQTG